MINSIIAITNYFSHDISEFKYFGEIIGNKFVNLDLRHEDNFDIINNDYIIKKLNIFFKTHKF